MNFLGIDVGTGGTRAVLINTQGSVVASATAEHTPFASPYVGWAEQDAADWWRATVAAVRALLMQDGVHAEEIAAVGFSGQMHGAVLLDERDEVLRPSIIWCDQRTDAQCRALTEQIGCARLIELTCNPALTNFTLPKILWVREHEPDVWKRVRAVLLPKDYVRLRLTGDRAIDVTDASGTLLFDVARRRWSEEMFAVVSAGADGFLWAPYLMGERTPHLDPHARAALVGLTASHKRAHVVRAILEGVTFSLRDTFEIFKEMGVPVETIRLGGGGARSLLWRQIQADVYGHAVETVAAEEGAAYGAALLAGVGAGDWSTVEAACEQAVKVASTHRPDKAAMKLMDKQYKAFRALYPALRDVMETIDDDL